MRKRFVALVSACTLTLAVTGVANSADMEIRQIPSTEARAAIGEATAGKVGHAQDIYIVQLSDAPVASYEGDRYGFERTKPEKGQKLDITAPHVKSYAAYLQDRQDQVIHSAGGRKVYNYSYAFNAFAARMTADNAEALRNRADVVNVWKDEIMYPQTDGSPNYLGLTEKGKIWSKGYTGENVVVGIIDSGIWPEHPSFADVQTPKKGNIGRLKSYGNTPDHFTPSGCDFGNMTANAMDAEFTCNQKLLSARCYNMGQSSGPDPSNPCGGDGAAQAGVGFQSARDDNGHGSHVASTAAGNYGVDAYIGGEFQGTVSGIAPRARIAAYKVCWIGGGCASSDSAAAIDQAVFDGVDVINFSIGGASNFFGGPDDIAFLFAADAGVWVATSNGNAGPAPGTVGTPSGVPWLTAVGATNDDGVFYDIVRANAPAEAAGDYTAVEGGGAGSTSLESAGPITADVMAASNLFACTPPDEDMTGKIALVSRGACSFSDKYNSVAAKGASAIVVYNDGANAGRIDPIAMSAPGTTIPGVMVSNPDGLAMAAAAGLNATLDAANVIPALNRIAEFSSRSPNNGAPDIIKPDVSAPGVATLAAASPAAGGEMFMSISGTSMASPHVAGAFAMLKQRHPDWSAAMARSALMTTARNGLMKSFRDEPADPFDVGAGEIMPGPAMNPELAYDVGLFDYAAFSCDNNTQIFSDGSCDFLKGLGYSTDASELNLPSMGIAELVGSQTITRTVTSVSLSKASKVKHFYATVDAPPGIDVSVSPDRIFLAKGETATYEVTFTVRDDAALDEWAFGSLTWNAGGHKPAREPRPPGWDKLSVRSPIAVRPTAFTNPAEVDGIADASGNGAVDVPVEFGYSGDYTADVSGIDASIETGPQNLTAGDGLAVFCVDLPANAHFRLAMFDEETSSPGLDDLDLRLFIAATDCDTFDIAQVGASGGITSEEVIDLPNGPAGGYVGVVDYYAAANGTDSDFNLWFQVVLEGAAGNTTVTAPASAVLGNSDIVNVEYSALEPTRNLGILHHMDANGEIGRTILDIDARP